MQRNYHKMMKNTVVFHCLKNGEKGHCKNKKSSVGASSSRCFQASSGPGTRARRKSQLGTISFSRPRPKGHWIIEKSAVDRWCLQPSTWLFALAFSFLLVASCFMLLFYNPCMHLYVVCIHMYFCCTYVEVS